MNDSSAPLAGPSTPSTFKIKGTGDNSKQQPDSLHNSLFRRIRSPSPEPGPSSSGYSTPLPKKAKTATSLLSRIGDAQETQSTTAHQVGLPDSLATPGVTPGGSAAVGFEAQEDFISFDASPPPPPSSKRKRAREVEDVVGSNRMKDRESGRSTPWTELVEWDECTNAIEMLNREAHAYIDYISPTPSEHELRLITVELIRRTVKARWKDAEVECFGSVGTGLYLPGGDIDLVLLSPTLPSPPLKPSSSLLHQIAALLLKSELAVPSSLIVIAKARVPIVKFVTRWGGFSVDMSVNQSNGVQAAVRVRAMLEEHAFRPPGWAEPGVAAGKQGEQSQGTVGPPPPPPTSKGLQPQAPLADHGVARSLVLLVKSFLAQRGMNEVFTGGLGSYSIICLVISFLQLHPNIQSGRLHPHYNLGLLFVEFVELYGRHFNYDITGISLRGRGGYFNKHDKGWYRGNQPYLLSIEDPNDPSNDVSGGSHNIIRVRQTLAGAYDSLTATLFQRNSVFAAQATSNSVPSLSNALLPNADSEHAEDPLRQSILGSVIGMSAAGVEAREDNVRLFEQGILQRLLKQSKPQLPGNLREGELAGSKKALKRARREALERERMEKTQRKLEQRAEEKREKEQRKKAKKDRVEESLAPRRVSSSGTATPIPTAAESGVVAVEQASNAQPFGAQGQAADDFVGLEFGSDGGEMDESDEEEEDSRYAVTRARQPSRSPAPVLYINSDSSESAVDSEEERSSDDDDVVIGGTGGSMVRTRSASQQPERQTRSRSRTTSGEDAQQQRAVSSRVVRADDASVKNPAPRVDGMTPSDLRRGAKMREAEVKRERKKALRAQKKRAKREEKRNEAEAAQTPGEGSTQKKQRRPDPERKTQAEDRARKMLDEAKGRGEREQSERARSKAEFWKAKGGQTEVLTIDD